MELGYLEDLVEMSKSDIAKEGLTWKPRVLSRNGGKQSEFVDGSSAEKDSEFIPFGRPNFSEEEIEAVARVMRSGWIGMGAEVLKFEEELAEFVNAPEVVSVNACTSALFLSLLVEGVGEGDEVICPSLTWCSTANAVLYLRGIPVFSDVDPNTLCTSVDSILGKVNERTKAVIVVHYGGYTVDIVRLRRELPMHIPIIEDAAHAIGAKYRNGTSVGSSGNLTCFSFYANKNLSIGEGGAIALFDNQKALRLRQLRHHGLHVDAWKRFSKPKSSPLCMVGELGYKMNLTDLQASIGRVQLRRQTELMGQRELIAKYYVDQLDQLGIKYQEGLLDRGHAKHLFVIFLPVEQMQCGRDQLVLELRKQLIGAAIHYTPLHHMQFYREKAVCNSLSNTDYVSSRIMTLPFSASISLGDAERVIEVLKTYVP